MSDLILKFWPEEDVQIDRAELIKITFKQKSIVGEESKYWGKPAFKGGNRLSEYFEPKWDLAPRYFTTLFLVIHECDYGIEHGSEDFVYFDRNNVVSLFGADGTIENWTDMCSELESITGDKYKGGWEIL